MDLPAPTPSPDTSRPVATDFDDYVSLKETREIFIAHGRPVSERTLQRSCVKGHIIGKKITTGEGEKWFALKSSVLTRIAELDKFDELRERHDATRRDTTQPVVEENQSVMDGDTIRQTPVAEMSQPVVPAQPSQSSSPDTSGLDATRRDTSAELEQIKALYGELIIAYKDQAEELRKDKASLQIDKAALLEQMVTKDRQIERFFSSERDTKTLFGTLQTLVASLLPGRSGGNRYVPQRDALDSGLADKPIEER